MRMHDVGWIVMMDAMHEHREAGELGDVVTVDRRAARDLNRQPR